MSIKQKIITIIVSCLSIAFMQIVYSPPSMAEGNCSKNASYDDPCMNANQSQTPLSTADFIQAVHACEARDSYGIGSGARLDSQSGNCSNAVASCYKNVTDKRVCTNDTYLAAASEYNNGNPSGKDWDAAIDGANRLTGGDDLDTNSGTRSKRNSAYTEAAKQACSGRPANEIDACNKAIQEAFDACYDQAGGSHAVVDETALKNCTDQKRASSAKTQGECNAIKGTWDNNTKKCTPPAPKTDTKKCTDGSTPDKDGKCADGSKAEDGTGTEARKTQKGDAGACGKARTNLIVCGENTKGLDALAAILKIALFVLTVIVGIASVGGIAYSAILYAGAQDNAGNTQKAKEYIRNIVIGLIAYGLMVAIIGWLVPGSVIG